MTDEAALRAAVLAHPDDDTPRLVYADWCDDAGDADRAAFIRAQVEAARAEPWSPTQREAEAQAAVLRQHNWTAWFPEIGGPNCEPVFARGFVHGVMLCPRDVTHVLPGLCAAHPIRSLIINYDLGASDYAELDPRTVILDAPELARLTALDLAPSLLYVPSEFEQLTDTDLLAGVTDLRLATLPVPPDWLGRFLEGPKLPTLVALDLADIPNLGPALANGLSAAQHRAFTRLNVSGVRFLSRELRRVLESSALAGVEELRLGWSYRDAGPATMIDLGWVLRWDRLRLLDLTGQQLGPDGVREITDRREAVGLRWLGLARNQLGDSGAHRLIESPHLHLYHLDVTGNDITPPLLAALRARFPEAIVVA